MKLYITAHAAERLRRRSISIDIMRACIEDPDKLIEQARCSNCFRSIKKIDGKVIVTVYRKNGELVVLITAWLSRRVDKYLRDP